MHNCPCAFCPVGCWPLCPTCSSFTFYHLYNISRYSSRLLFSQLIKHTCLLSNEFDFVSLLSVSLYTEHRNDDDFALCIVRQVAPSGYLQNTFFHALQLDSYVRFAPFRGVMAPCYSTIIRLSLDLDLDTTRRRLCRLLPRHECQWLPGSSIYIYTLYTFVGGSKGATL